jgi:hypothetical protein
MTMENALEQTSFDKIIISKPRRIEDTYICTLYYNQKKENLQITFTNMTLISYKPLKDRNEFIIYCKNKNYNNFLFDFSSFIIEQVKEKSFQWFKNDHLIDLIDDYYKSPLIYDKKHGDIICLKCIGDEHLIKENIGKKMDIKIKFTQLKFYKRKFLLECEIIDLKECNPKYNIEYDIKSDTDDAYEEIPEPTLDDINEIKKEYIDISENYINKLKTMMSEIETKVNTLENIKKDLLNTSNIKNVISLYNELEKLCE